MLTGGFGRGWTSSRLTLVQILGALGFSWGDVAQERPEPAHNGSAE